MATCPYLSKSVVLSNPPLELELIPCQEALCRWWSVDWSECTYTLFGLSSGHRHSSHEHPLPSHECQEGFITDCGSVPDGTPSPAVNLINEFLYREDQDGDGQLFGVDFKIKADADRPAVLNSIENHPRFPSGLVEIPWASYLSGMVVNYASIAGLTEAFIYSRKSDIFGEKKPLVILIHGSWASTERVYPQGLGTFFDHNIYWGRTLFDAGYVAVVMSYRGATVYKHPQQIIDVKRTIRYFKTNAEVYNIDPDRICLLGQSGGAHLSSLSALTEETVLEFNPVEYPGVDTSVKCVVCAEGPYNLVKFLDAAYLGAFNPALIPYLTQLLADCFEVADQNPVFYAMMSPISYSEGNTRFLIIHSNSEDIIPPALATEFRDYLLGLGRTVELIEVEGANHGLEPVIPGVPISPTIEEIGVEILDFLSTNL